MAEEEKPAEEEAAKKEAEEAEVRRQGAIFTPEGVVMLVIAAIIDIIDFFIGSFFVLDIVAMLTIGVWIYFHSQQFTVTKGTAARMSAWTKRLRWLRPLMIVLEWIPIVGMLPLWVLLVYFELKQ
jgi:hypothetical protein